MAEQEHPFLICRRSQFAALRRRASKEPWTSMRADAIGRANNGVDTSHPVRLHRAVGACALAYILEEGKKQPHADRVRDAILHKLDEIAFDPKQPWSGTVPPMGAAFVCILALDIVHDDLTPEEVAACEAVIEKQIDKIPRRGAWAAARYGTHGTWDIYTGARTEPDDAYYRNVIRQMTEDGVSTVAPGYAFARLGAADGRVRVEVPPGRHGLRLRNRGR
jgi:hypothetical protein